MFPGVEWTFRSPHDKGAYADQQKAYELSIFEILPPLDATMKKSEPGLDILLGVEIPMGTVETLPETDVPSKMSIRSAEETHAKAP